MNKKYFIYITTNLVNNKKYIGYHFGTENDSYLGSGVLLAKAIKQYGRKNFKREILEYCDSKKNALEKEKFWIAKYNAVEDPNFYNISEGGEKDAGWQQARKWALEHPEEAQKVYQQSIKRMQDWWKNHPKEAEENKQRLIENAKRWREENPEKVKENTERLQNGRKKYWKEHPEEHQKQIDAWREAGSIANSKKVRCITTGEEFPSISEAARYYGVQQANISKALKGERKSAGKHPKTGEKLFWEFI